MKRILVIEDNETNMYLTKFMLEKNGYEVLEARDGLSGVALAKNEKLDLILMDIKLPDINGMEATGRIRAFNKDIPIVAVTSYAMVGDKEKTLAAGCTGYIEKPINPDTFIGNVKKFLPD
jgi:two-component system cell cycle response regulator DivK